MVKHLVDKVADRVRVGYIAAFLLLVLSYILTFYSAQKLIKQANLVTHTNEVIYNLDYVMSAVHRSESDFRGYLVTGNRELLSSFQNEKRIADSTLDHVQLLTTDNQNQHLNLSALAVQMHRLFATVDNYLLTFEQNENGITAAASEAVTTAIMMMSELEKAVKVSQNEEKGLLGERSTQLSRYTDTIQLINLISIGLAIVLTVYSISTFSRENKARRIADFKTAEYRLQLEQRFEELAKVNLELIELRNIEKFSVTGRISRTIAHEVRNPLTNINLAVEHLKSEKDASEDAQMLFEMITRNTSRINELISNLLNSTRTAEMTLESESINNILDQSLQFAEDRVELKKIRVVKEYSDDICEIMVDKEKIHIAFLNIIVNAIEAMEENGTLYLTTRDDNEKCVAIIRDTGKGMSKSDVSKLFEPYFTTKENGNGLGLTNTQNIILGHNAKIIAESELGRGTTFTVILNYAATK